MSQTILRIGPADNGRRMSLGEFEDAEIVEGYRYELGRGVIVVSDVPGRKHLRQVECARDQVRDHKRVRPGKIRYALGSGECKLLIPDYESERHPDLAVYLTEPPQDNGNFWAEWIPEIVLEVVSLGSEYRDYMEKRDEYLALGVREYWIIDAEKREMLVLRRVGERWTEKVVRPATTYKTRLLPGFAFDLAAVFVAAEAGE